MRDHGLRWMWRGAKLSFGIVDRSEWGLIITPEAEAQSCARLRCIREDAREELHFRFDGLSPHEASL